MYRVGRGHFMQEDGRLAAALARAYAQKERPACLCTGEPGIPMCIARLGDVHVLKRMPESGATHHPDCPSFAPPPELSGVGELLGTAIRENAESGETLLRLDFRLTKAKTRAAPKSGDQLKDTVKTDGQKLTLRGLLHYLWNQAGLHRWTPAMAGRRSWGVVHKRLLAAALGASTRGGSLASLLLVPEPFFTEQRHEIAARRTAFVSPTRAGIGTQKLMVLVGEVKEFGPARYGQKLVVKHLPDFPVLLSEDLYGRMIKRFAAELEMWTANDSTHLIVIATFALTSGGFASAEQLSLMVASSNWIPVDDKYELQLVQALTEANRRFTKSLRYNVAPTRPVTAAVVTDTQPQPVGLYIVPADAPDDFRSTLRDLLKDTELPYWFWISDQALPALPCFERHTSPSLGVLEPEEHASESSCTIVASLPTRKAPRIEDLDEASDEASLAAHQT